MKKWLDSIFQTIKNNKQTAVYIVLAALALTVIVLSIVIAVLRRKVDHGYEKEDFVHKMILQDVSIPRQITLFGAIATAIAFLVLFFLKKVTAAYICGYVTLAFSFLNVWYKAISKFDRVEYNLKDLYQFKFLCKTRKIAWKDVDKVTAVGVGNSRKIIFYNGRKKIVVCLKHMGAYEFTVFAEKQLEGKNFEAIKIAKGRQM